MIAQEVEKRGKIWSKEKEKFYSCMTRRMIKLVTQRYHLQESNLGKVLVKVVGKIMTEL